MMMMPILDHVRNTNWVHSTNPITHGLSNLGSHVTSNLGLKGLIFSHCTLKTLTSKHEVDTKLHNDYHQFQYFSYEK